MSTAVPNPPRTIRTLARFVVAVVGAIGLIAAMGCATRQQAGAVGGAGAGAVAGAAISEGHPLGMLLGALAGAAIGSEIGRQMDAYDRQQAAMYLETAPTYESRSWVNPDTGHAYRMTPVETYENPRGAPCREFRMEAQVGSGWEEVYGTACRQADGSWRVTET